MKKKDNTQSWSSLCYATDPELREPRPTYIFRNGQRVFYTPDKKNKRKR